MTTFPDFSTTPLRETTEGAPLPDGMVRRVAPATVGSADEIDPRTPRNAICPCGSGKKYKHCHGRVG